jgi:predicted aldo/keto reductase-like oxidoreductase
MNAKKLGFGLMRLPLTNPDDARSIDIDLTCKMVDTFIERGFTYFDTAWMYCGHASEDATKQALVDRYPRDSYTLATKLHAA